MTTDDREFWLATTSWLEAGSDATPPEAVDAVLLAIKTTRQERVLRSPWRPITMSAFAKIAIAAAAAVAVALVWINFGPSSDVGGAPPIPTPTPSPTPMPSFINSSSFLPLAAGRYGYAIHWPNPAMTFTVPSTGWTADQFVVGKGANADKGGPSAAGAWMMPYPFDHGFKDPCTDHTPVVPAAGSGPDGLLDVIVHQPGINSTGKIVDVSVGGIAGRAVDYTVTADPTTCGNGQDGFWIFGSCRAPVAVGCEMVGDGDRRYGVFKNARERAYVIPVGGKFYTIVTSQPGDLSAADQQELQTFLDSIAFGPTN
jgi:hypothetical protein